MAGATVTASMLTNSAAAPTTRNNRDLLFNRYSLLITQKAYRRVSSALTRALRPDIPSDGVIVRQLCRASTSCVRALYPYLHSFPFKNVENRLYAVVAVHRGAACREPTVMAGARE